ncbi:MAG: RHS repeat-associated core domain-containing protein [Bacteroidota bacterium]
MENTQTSGNQGQQLESVPQITTFQFDKESIGKIKDSVNLFRGTVSLPINLVSLPGHSNLDENLLVLYGSNVRTNLENWNITHPTGSVGLGWQLLQNKIVVNKKDSGAMASDEYYLISGGSANQLIQTGVDAEGALTFETRNFEFWLIRYFPNKEVWEITHENGNVLTYGDSSNERNTVEYGVRWGNWMGDSSLTLGQEQYVTAWNLSEKKNLWGSTVTYSYLQITQSVGDSSIGKKFTQASYLKEVTDSLGRKMVYNYGDKYGPDNPGPNGEIEYQPANDKRPAPNAYQDTYETKYLDYVDILSSSGDQLFGIHFQYKFINIAYQDAPYYKLSFKRTISSIIQVSSEGRVLPGYEFDYFNKVSDNSPGSLKSIVFPFGGIANYSYKKQSLNAPRNLKIDNPISGATPRVWHGPDYSVVTWYNQSQKQMKAEVYSWSGTWTKKELSAQKSSIVPFHNVDFDLDTLGVITQRDIIVLYFTNKSTNALELYFYNRSQTDFGTFDLEKGPERLTLKQNAKTPSSVAFGDNYIIASNKDFASQPFYGYQWSWKKRQWQQNITLPSFSDARNADHVAIGAKDNYFLTAFYFKAQKSAKFQLIYHNGVDAWDNPSNWNESLTVFEDDQNPEQFPFVFSLASSLGSCTFVSAISQTEISYTIKTFQWDTQFRILNPGNSISRDYTSPIEDGKSQFNVLQTFNDSALVANNAHLDRYVGGPGNSNNPLNWISKSFNTSASNTYDFVFGTDVGVMSETNNGSTNNTYYQFDPNFPDSSGWGSEQRLPSLGKSPSLLGNYLTAGSEVFFRDTSASWRKLDQQLINLNAPESIQNRAPNFIVYQDNTESNAQTYITYPRNGQIDKPTKVSLPSASIGQKVYVEQESPRPGTLLAGINTFVTYPSDQEFDSASFLTIYRVVDRAVSGNLDVEAVANVNIENLLEEESFWQSYDYSGTINSRITFDPKNDLPQFPQVRVIPDTKSPDEGLRPQGSVVNFFSNGVSEQTNLPYPTGWIYNYNLLLNGNLLARNIYNSAGQQVASELNYYSIYQQNARTSNYYYAGYSRITKTVMTQDGVVKTTDNLYDEFYGQLKSSSFNYYDSLGKQKKLMVEKTYAIQIPTYKNAMVKLNLLTNVVQETVSVTDLDTKEKNITSSNVSTWKNWDESQPEQWAVLQKFQWQGVDSNEPIFDFSDPAPQPGWLELSEVISRNSATGNITEQTTTDGMITSYLYDKNGRYQIAEFPDASMNLEETSYYGFETIESPQHWQIANGAAIIPNDDVQEVDAHTGINSLMLPISTVNGISAELTPGNPDVNTYIFSCFFKKPASYDNSSGNAQWKVTFEQGGNMVGSPIEVDFPDIKNTWSYLFFTINLADFDRKANGNVRLNISATNNNSQSYVLLDNLRFSPLHCNMGAVNLATNTDMIDAIIGSNGDTKRILFDDFLQEVAATNNADVTSELRNFYYSRSGNNDQFDPAVPNSLLVANAAEGGSLISFSRGEEYLKVWDTNSPTDWKIVDQQLEWSSSQQGTLTFKDTSCVNQYGISAKVVTNNSPTQPLGIKIGSEFTIQYLPSESKWVLLSGNGENLNESLLRSKEYTRLQATKAEDSNSFGTQWMLFVGKKSIIFFVDGLKLFSHIADTEISGVPQIFVADPASIGYLVNSKANKIAQTFLNGTATDQQSQLLFDTKVSAIQNIFDSLGRAAIHTKPAYIAPNDHFDLLAYRSDLAIYDWDTAIMTGEIQTIYPEDEGFPFFQEFYEDSQLGRVIETTMPGKVYSSKEHTARNSYGSNDGSNGLPAHQYYKVTLTDQNGNFVTTITDQRGSEICKVSQQGKAETDVIIATNIFDDSGNAIQQFVPNYFNPPGGSNKEDWIVYNEYDFLGRNVKTTTSDTGTVKMLYDNSGRMRFRQDQQGQVDSNYQYFKYDIQGRLTEMGFLEGSWDSSQLKTIAASDPEWPSTPNTWRKMFVFDGNGIEQNEIGRLVEIQVNSSDNGQVSSFEEFAYDINGNITTKKWGAAKIGSDPYFMNYHYNAIGDMILVEYPTKNDQAPMKVSYGYNEIGQIIGVGSSLKSTDDIATYTYNATGKPEKEILNTAGAQPIQRSFDYNSPVWLEKLSAHIVGTENAIFEENMRYKARNDEETTYFNGQPSSWGLDYKSGNEDYQNDRSCHYNGLGALTSNSNSNSGKNAEYAYDENNNFKVVSKGNIEVKFNYNQNNSIAELSNPTGTEKYAKYDYDHNGSIIEVEDTPDGSNISRHLRFEYDPGIMLTSTIHNLKESNLSYNFEYGGLNLRIIKETVKDDVSQGMKVYVRGLNTSPLMTFNSTGDNTVSDEEYIIYGPMGLLATTDLSSKKYLIRDHLNSTRLVLDENATILASYSYDVFGKLDILHEAYPQVCDYLYTGQEWDSEFELYNFKNRFYFSEIGRFAAADLAKQFYSPYVYAGNNPIIFIDPSGNFSIGNFFSAIAGAIIGVVEILIGVVIDVVAAVLEVVTGGLATPAAVGLAALSGFFYGAGISAVTYSAVGLVTNDFSWKDYGISMGVGAVTGAIFSAFGAAGAAVQASAKASITAATEAGRAASTIAKVANVAAKPAFTITGSAVSATTGTFLNNAAYGRRLDTGLGEAFITGAISGTLGWAIPTPDYKAGWGQFAKRAAANIAKKEGIGVSMQVTKNAIHGDPLNKGLLNTVVSGVVSGTNAGIGASGYGEARGKEINNFLMAF